MFTKILAAFHKNEQIKKEHFKKMDQLKESSKIKSNPLYMSKKVFVPDEIQINSRQQHIKELKLEDCILLTPNLDNSSLNITDESGNDIGILLPSKANEFKNQIEDECTKYEANVIDIKLIDGYYKYSFVIMAGVLKDQSHRFSSDDDSNAWDDNDYASDWDDHDEDGTHYSDFPDKYGYDRD